MPTHLTSTLKSQPFTWRERAFVRAEVPTGDNRGKVFTVAQPLAQRYQVANFFASGGMGILLEGLDLRTQCRVLIKTNLFYDVIPYARVRDQEGLTYGINSRFRAPSLAAGPWYVGVSVNPNNIEKAINSALNVLRDYVEKGIRADELADEKSSAIGSFKVSLATNGGLAQAMWNAEFYRLGMDYIDRYPQIIQAVTIKEVNAAIRKYFRPDHLTVVIAGDIETTPAVAAPTV